MFKVFSCVIYTIIGNYVCIDYIGSEKKHLSALLLFPGGCYKHFNKRNYNLLGIGIPYMLINLLSCHGFLRNKDYVVILKCPNRMFEYHLNKIFVIFDCDKDNLEKLPSEIKDIIGTKVTDNSDKFMICSTTIPSTSNTLKNLLVNASFHSSYIQK